jgi:hypothetical protein
MLAKRTVGDGVESAQFAHDAFADFLGRHFAVKLVGDFVHDPLRRHRPGPARRRDASRHARLRLATSFSLENSCGDDRRASPTKSPWCSISS